jgi:AAA15 family ATPase/GTPase
MLRKWTIENFKSVRGRIDLELGKLTIFAGANSSGKSTILHSILLAKQTIRYGPISRPLTLNGPILKLGFFDEVKHSGASENHIGFSGEFAFGPDSAISNWRLLPMEPP